LGLGLGRRAPADDVIEVHDKDEAVEVNADVPARREPADRERDQNAEQHGHLRETKHVIDLEVHRSVLEVHILDTGWLALGEPPFESAGDDARAPAVGDAGQEDRPDVDEREDTEGDAVPLVQAEVGVHRV
jgi:hypothetical protein